MFSTWRMDRSGLRRGSRPAFALALALLECDHGRALAMAVAREMVLFLVRPGGRAQFSATLDLQHRSGGSALAELPGWLEGRL